jgi:hypothetical protein
VVCLVSHNRRPASSHEGPRVYSGRVHEMLMLLPLLWGVIDYVAASASVASQLSHSSRPPPPYMSLHCSQEGHSITLKRTAPRLSLTPLISPPRPTTSLGGLTVNGRTACLPQASGCPPSQCCHVDSNSSHSGTRFIPFPLLRHFYPSGTNKNIVTQTKQLRLLRYAEVVTAAAKTVRSHAIVVQCTARLNTST